MACCASPSAELKVETGAARKVAVKAAQEVAMEQQATLVDKFLSRLKNNRLAAVLIAAGRSSSLSRRSPMPSRACSGSSVDPSPRTPGRSWEGSGSSSLRQV